MNTRPADFGNGKDRDPLPSKHYAQKRQAPLVAADEAPAPAFHAKIV